MEREAKLVRWGLWMKIKVTERKRRRRAKMLGKELLRLGGSSCDVHHSNIQ